MADPAAPAADAAGTLAVAARELAPANHATMMQFVHELVRAYHGWLVVVAEEGTNDELIARNGVYAELHRIQYESPRAHAPT